MNKEVLWMKKIRNVFIVFLFLFEFSGFAASGITVTSVCYAINKRLCPTGWRLGHRPDGSFGCICGDSTTPATCPATATQVKRTFQFAAPGAYRCSDARLYQDDHGWTGSYLYPATGSDRHRRMRMCIKGAYVLVSNISKPLSCGVYERHHEQDCKPGYVKPDGTVVTQTDCNNQPINQNPNTGKIAFSIVVTCPPNDNNDQECRDLLTSMMNGKVTVETGADRKGLPESVCTYEGSYTGLVRTGPNGTGDYPKKACVLPLVNRDTGARLSTSDLLKNNVILWADNNDSRLRRNTHRMADLRCVANNIRFQDICECNNGCGYEFPAGTSQDTCDCPGGTCKPANGTCPACPTDAYLAENGQCKCYCKGGNIDVAVPTTGTCDPLALCDTTPPPSDKCANEANWNAPNSSPIHSYVKGPFPALPNNNVNTADRCPDGGIIVDVSGVDYCETPQICDEAGTSNETRNCTSPQEKVTAQYGDCVAVGGGGVNTKCISYTGTGVTPVSIFPANPDGTCSRGWPLNRPDVKGPCTLVDFTQPYDESSWSCSSYPGSQKVLNINTTPLSCACLESASTTYICEQGVPSSQDANCECNVSRVEQDCEFSDGHIWTQTGSNPILGTCDCPSSWTKSLIDDTCSKTPNIGAATINTMLVAHYNSSEQLTMSNLPSGVPAPATKTDAENASWTCLNQSYEDPNGFMCTKYDTIKTCPDGGTYNMSTQKCEMPCVQQSTTPGCKCVRDIAGTCGCVPGWTQVGGKCHKPALAPPSSQYCTCDCDLASKDTDIRYDLGSDMDLRIKADILANPSSPTECVIGTDPICKPLPDLDCCHQDSYYRTCPFLGPPPSYDGNCPEYCLDGNPPPSSPGGCCPNGQALSDLKDCPGGVYRGGSPKGIDIAFGLHDMSSIYSVYSAGSMDRPDYICWKRDTSGGSTTKVQMRNLFCPPRSECSSDLSTQECQCQTLDGIVQEDTYCEYASIDPMRYEEGIIRGDVPLTPRTLNDPFQTDIRIFKTTPIVTP